MAKRFDFSVQTLGECRVTTPVSFSREHGDRVANYVLDSEQIVFDISVKPGQAAPKYRPQELLQLAGPREKIYFSPAHTHAGIVTCGGLCPGLNDVIRAIVRCLWHRYSVRRISGIRFGYQGFLPENNFDVLELNPDVVDDIHKIGGTVIGSSRGGGDRVTDIVDAMERMNLNVLFTIGGDGTQKGASRICEEISRRNLKIAVVGIPKTIDNDLSFIEKSFGFETAVSQAAHAVFGAHTEAHSAINGIGLVKLMGREAGFIAAQTALASHEANFVLIPEVPFDLDGENGLLHHLEVRLARRNHAVIIAAEGAGQNLMAGSGESDLSGNRKLSDIGVFLRDRIQSYFKAKNVPINLKYIDPSYIIRSAVADPTDSVYCSRLGNNAVHAAMAGKTRVLISLVNNHFVHIPIDIAVERRNSVDPEDALWRDVIEATGQPVLMVNS